MMKTGTLILLLAMLALGLVLGFVLGSVDWSEWSRPPVRIVRPPDPNSEPGSFEKPAVIIAVDDQGKARIGDKAYDLESLTAYLKTNCPPDEYVEIRADERVGYEHIAPILRACVDAGVSRTNITAVNRE